MEDYGAMIRRTFQQGSVLDAQTLFEAFLHNAFPTFHFRRPEVISFSRGENEAMEECRRVTMGETPDKQVYLDYLTLGFVSYAEK